MKQMKKILAALLVAVLCLSMVAALAESGTVYTTGNVNMRKGAGTDYSRILTIPSGTNITLLSAGNKWSQVSYGGRTGYIHNNYWKYR